MTSPTRSNAWVLGPGTPRLVSVIIPTYNRAHLLGETLASILGQSYSSIEVVVVDDGSTDNTGVLLKEWAKRCQDERGWRLLYLSQPHLGAQHARNAGTLASTGEYLNYLDDDDLLSSRKIEAQVTEAQRTGADIVYGSHRYFVSARGGYRLFSPVNARPHTMDRGALAAWLAGWDLCVMASLVTRNLVQAIGPWDTALARGQDADYKVRCLLSQPHIVHCSRGLLYCRYHACSIGSSRSSAGWRSLHAQMEALERHLASVGMLEAVRPSLCARWLRTARLLALEGAWPLAYSCLARARALSPTVRLPSTTGLFLSALWARYLAAFKRWVGTHTRWRIGESVWVRELPLRDA